MKHFSLKKISFLCFCLQSILYYSQNFDCSKQINEQLKNDTSDPKRSIQIGLAIQSHCKNDSIIALNHLGFGRAYKNLGEDKKAYYHLKEADKSLYKYKGCVRQNIVNKIALSEIFKTLELYDESLDYVNEGLNDLENQKKQYLFLKAVLLSVKGGINANQQANKEALKNYSSSATTLQQYVPENEMMATEKLAFEAYIKSEMAGVYVEMKQYQTAKTYALKAIALSEKHANNNNYAVLYGAKYRLAKAYLGLNDVKNAVKIGDSVAAIKNLTVDINRNINNLLSDSYLKLNQTELSKIHKLKADSIQQTILTEKTKVTKELYLAVNEDLKEKERNNFLLLGGIAATILAFSGLIFYLVNKHRKQIKINKENFEKIIASFSKENKAKQQIIKTDSEESLSESELKIVERLDKFEEKKGFTNKNLSLAILATDFQTNTTTLSEVINKVKGKNFNNYVNELRINYITEKMYCDPQILNFKISYIGELCGFGSYTTFANAFKKVTNVSPSAYLEECKKHLIIT